LPQSRSAFGGSLLLQDPFDHRYRRVGAGHHNVLHTSSPEELTG
jgi:hypothetical protein